MYFVESFQLTERTVVYKVKVGSKCIATFGKEKAANSFAKYINDNKIFTIEEWRKQPRIVKNSFISATMLIQPNF